jgi:hypothetical protein
MSKDNCGRGMHAGRQVRRFSAIVALAVAWASVCAAADWDQNGGVLVARTGAYALRFDPKTGAPAELTLGGKPVLAFGADGWWTLRVADGQPLRAADCTAKIEQNGDELRCTYTSARATVLLTVGCRDREIELRTAVEMKEGIAERLALPAKMTFKPEQIAQVHFPVELGRALKRPFFQAQTGARPAGWKQKTIGPAGAKVVGISPAKMLPYDGPAVKVDVTEPGRQWLGKLAARMSTWTVLCPRAPEATPDVTLLTTANGPLLSLQSVDGGWGYVIRWGGVFGGQDIEPFQRPATRKVIEQLWQRPVAAGGKIAPPEGAGGKPRRDVMPKSIAVVDLGQSLFGQPNEWTRLMEGFGCKVRELTTPEELLDALQKRTDWLVINPYAELLPARAEKVDEMTAAIRSYVTHGGVWLHTGSYPFYHALEPQLYYSVEAVYPPAFSDFLHVDAGDAQVSVYGVRDPQAIFVPGVLSARGTPEGGELTRECVTWVEPGKKWDAPVLRIVVGAAVQDSVRAYGKANGFDRPLAEKIKPDVLAKLKRSVLLNYWGDTYKEQAEVAALLPAPLLFHTTNFLAGGFDKQYPDHLPPHPKFGAPEEFAAFIKSAQQAGHLYMPYTNPTWWCDDPPGPTSIKAGDAPLARDRQGRRIKEAYWRNWGWSLCTQHPAAQAAEAMILRQFTQEYPVDVLFQDQVGARHHVYDFNPAAPTPYAFVQGMIDIAKRNSRSVPLSTENGFDAVMNYEAQFCGITWGLVPTEHPPAWVRTWSQQYAPETWGFSPLALWLGHDKIVFAHHDLGQFVTNREMLAWTLALGYQLSLRSDAKKLRTEENRQWLIWLSSVQRAVGPHIIGAPLRSWAEPRPGVFRAQYGEATVIANTTAEPYVLDDKTTLAKFGFLVTAPKLTAGWVDRFDGKDYPESRAFVTNDGQ